MADEVLHASIGKDRYVSSFGNQKEAIDHGSACWNKVLIGWREWQQKGLTEHRNWPELYAAFCEIHGLKPDPAALDSTPLTKPRALIWKSWP